MDRGRSIAGPSKSKGKKVKVHNARERSIVWWFHLEILCAALCDGAPLPPQSGLCPRRVRCREPGARLSLTSLTIAAMGPIRLPRW